jgi:hypothetical protein
MQTKNGNLQQQSNGLKVKTRIKAGARDRQHNQKTIREKLMPAPTKK